MLHRTIGGLSEGLCLAMVVPMHASCWDYRRSLLSSRQGLAHHFMDSPPLPLIPVILFTPPHPHSPAERKSLEVVERHLWKV